MKQLLDKQHKVFMQWLLEDDTIKPSVFLDVDHFESYQICDIYDDGTIVLGKTRCRWWNHLIKCETKLSFLDFAFGVWKAFVGLSSNTLKNGILKGLSWEIIENAIQKKEYNVVIDRFVDVARHALSQSKLFSKGTPSVEEHDIVNVTPAKVEITIVDDDEKRRIPVFDAVGRPVIYLRRGIIGYETK